MKSMKKLVLAGLVLLASVMVLAGCKNDSVPQEPKVYEFTSEPQILSNYESSNNTGDEWTYIAFGDWPQTIKADGVTVDETKSREMGMFTAYLGSDGNYYVEAEERACGLGSQYKYSDGTQVGRNGTSKKWFKVEPIVWRVLNKDSAGTGTALLLAENILTGGIPYYVEDNRRTITGADTKDGEANTVYSNNYKYSTIRAWLNGKYEKDDTQVNTYTGKGFLQTAFTEKARDQLADTDVDNSVTSTLPNTLTDDQKSSDWNNGENPYASETKTEDKIFLLSEQEVTKKDYGFAEYDVYVEDDIGTTTSTRIRVTTDYAKATGTYQDSGADSGGWWWLRSPYYAYTNRARYIDIDGNASYYRYVCDTDGGVVPALCITFP